MKTNSKQIEITTGRDQDGTYFFEFDFNGKTYSDCDFTTRERALEEAKSVARQAFNAA